MNIPESEQQSRIIIATIILRRKILLDERLGEQQKFKRRAVYSSYSLPMNQYIQDIEILLLLLLLNFTSSYLHYQLRTNRPPDTCHLPPTTFHLPHATCHLPTATWHLPPGTCHLSTDLTKNLPKVISEETKLIKTSTQSMRILTAR